MWLIILGTKPNVKALSPPPSLLLKLVLGENELGRWWKLGYSHQASALSSSWLPEENPSAVWAWEQRHSYDFSARSVSQEPLLIVRMEVRKTQSRRSPRKTGRRVSPEEPCQVPCLTVIWMWQAKIQVEVVLAPISSSSADDHYNHLELQVHDIMLIITL